MNLVQDAWLPFRMRDGAIQELKIADIVREDVVDLALPRADFQGAAYQLIIGLLQTLIAPENAKKWHEVYKNPLTVEELQQQLDRVLNAFNLVGEAPLFMQDFDELSDVTTNDISGLLIDAPGENGIKNNTDFFVKRNTVDVLSLPMTALALFTLQINAPSGGQGHRVGIRGGGPLTSLLLPKEDDTSLWEKLFVNVICRDVWSYDDPDLNSADVFPWLAKTKISKNKNTEVYANDVHALTTFWAMPRRIRLEVEKGEELCSISGQKVNDYVSRYRTQNYGNNYAGLWRHPFTAYRFNPKKPDEPPSSVKAQPGGLTYRYWDVVLFSSNAEGQISSLNIDNFFYISNRREKTFGYAPRVWCFGYDMDNMKARGYYDIGFPLFYLELERKTDFFLSIKQVQELTNKCRLELNKRIKEAWFERPSDNKGDFSFITIQFLQRTESVFFELVQSLSLQEDYSSIEAITANTWLSGVQKIAESLFDEYTLSGDVGDAKQLQRIMQARRFLSIWLHNSRDVKSFIKQHDFSLLEEVVNEG